jgi:hypothetical protein
MAANEACTASNKNGLFHFKKSFIEFCAKLRNVGRTAKEKQVFLCNSKEKMIFLCVLKEKLIESVGFR